MSIMKQKSWDLFRNFHFGDEVFAEVDELGNDSESGDDEDDDT